jgi:integrase
LPLQRRSSLSLSEAREKARIGRELAKAGITPSSVWKQDDEPALHTFEEAAKTRHKEIKKGWKNAKHADQWLSSLTRYVFPELGSKHVEDVDAAAIQKVLLPIWLTKGETARRVKQRIGVILDYSHAQGWRSKEAPMRAVNQLMRGIKQPQKSNFAAMAYSDVPAFVATLNAGELSVGRSALLFLMLTAARSGEVRGAKWSEIDLEGREWRIPGSRMKAGKPHIIPLVGRAVEILEVMKSLFQHDAQDAVFPGNKTVLSDATLAKVLRVNGGTGFTVHGFRSSFRDWAADSGFPDGWAEAALAHGNPDKTEAAYRRTTYFSQRRDALMPAWENFLFAAPATTRTRPTHD